MLTRKTSLLKYYFCYLKIFALLSYTCERKPFSFYTKKSNFVLQCEFVAVKNISLIFMDFEAHCYSAY